MTKEEEEGAQRSPDSNPGKSIRELETEFLREVEDLDREAPIRQAAEALVFRLDRYLDPETLASQLAISRQEVGNGIELRHALARVIRDLETSGRELLDASNAGREAIGRVMAVVLQSVGSAREPGGVRAAWEAEAPVFERRGKAAEAFEAVLDGAPAPRAPVEPGSRTSTLEEVLLFGRVLNLSVAEVLALPDVARAKLRELAGDLVRRYLHPVPVLVEKPPLEGARLAAADKLADAASRLLWDRVVDGDSALSQALKAYRNREPISGRPEEREKTRTEDRSRYILCVDFDGVVHAYSSGWKGACEIPDPPVPGAFEWLQELLRDGGFEVCIYSSRSKEPGGVQAMRVWMARHGFTQHELDQLAFPTQKPAASMTVDDRAVCFLGPGSFPSAEWLRAFKPWNKK